MISVVLWHLVLNRKHVMKIYFGVNEKVLIYCIVLLQLLISHGNEQISSFLGENVYVLKLIYVDERIECGI